MADMDNTQAVLDGADPSGPVWVSEGGVMTADGDPIAMIDNTLDLGSKEDTIESSSGELLNGAVAEQKQLQSLPEPQCTPQQEHNQSTVASQHNPISAVPESSRSADAAGDPSARVDAEKDSDAKPCADAKMENGISKPADDDSAGIKADMDKDSSNNNLAKDTGTGHDSGAVAGEVARNSIDAAFQDSEILRRFASNGVIKIDSHKRKNLKGKQQNRQPRQAPTEEIKGKFRKWAESFLRLDPRYKILMFFNEVGRDGADNMGSDEYNNVNESRRSSNFLKMKNIAQMLFNVTSIMTVWRPCSKDAMRHMMEGTGVGKGIDIKGKVCQNGKLSGFVPYLQIHQDEHKRQVSELSENAKMRIFYSSNEARKVAQGELQRVAKELKLNNHIRLVDDYAPERCGLELSQKIFWECYILKQSIFRRIGSEYDSGNPSVPELQDMNHMSLQNQSKEPDAPIAVVYQNNNDNPMCVFNLLMAYEENGRVMPVVSNFDGFLLGWRREALWFGCDLPREQVDLMDWSMQRIDEILDGGKSSASWTKRWSKMLKKEKKNGFEVDIPQYGFGDPKTYSIMEEAAFRLIDTGAVRHGMESFNYYSPTELDGEFLVIADDLPGKVPWIYVNQSELREILSYKIDQGFMFPLNPKWIICDFGWKHLYDKLMASHALYADLSQDVWYPPRSGIREKIEYLCKKHPCGFRRQQPSKEMKKKFQDWAISFRKLDPRYKILTFFNEVARDGADNMGQDDEGYVPIAKRSTNFKRFQRLVQQCFNITSVMTVWRPCSYDAMRHMMQGTGVGKGLDIKGKSCRRGKLSGFVPYLQIHVEKHKSRVSPLNEDARLKVFYSSSKARKIAHENLFYSIGAQSRSKLKSRSGSYADIHLVDDYAPKSYGLELSQQLFWDVYVAKQNITREEGSKYDTGRQSVPGFQDMNQVALQNRDKPPGAPIAVVQQHSTNDPMCVFNLLMAYEENGRVVPVVSDFDGFLLGWRREALWFGCDLPAKQVDLMNWSVQRIERILEKGQLCSDWTDSWFKMLKKEKERGFHVDFPRYGFGDPKSYSIMEQAALRLIDTGAVRHGMECFNYYFPQELDETFLVISEFLPGKVPWKYVNQTELLKILSINIDEGFMFPINPKWIICDPGWKRLYDKLMASNALYADLSKDVWYPPSSGIREKIETICKKHPNGFEGNRKRNKYRNNVTKLQFFAKDRVMVASGKVGEKLIKMTKSHMFYSSSS